MHLKYYADPLCSWCYGFGPELAKFMERRPDLPVELVMGGLRAYNRESMSTAFRTMLREHWNHVAVASGVPFSQALLDDPAFVYDTEPACRAVVAARKIFPGQAFGLMRSIQSAFFRDGRDATSAEVLVDLAAAQGYDAVVFRALFDSEAMQRDTRADFAATQTMGVSGFPTLALSRGEELYLVTSGFVTHDVLEYRVAEIERLAPQAAT